MAKIVIVENDTDIAPLLQQLLMLEGHSPILVSDPAKAVDVIRQERPNLVYLDVRLTPEVDGFMLLKRIRAESDVPVLMSSGLDVEAQCIKQGASAFLLKPFDFADLLEGIQRATKGRGL